MYKFFIAWCFLARRRVTWLAGLAIALTVTVFIVIMAVLEGLSVELGAQARRASADIQISTRELAGVHDPDEVSRVVTAQVPAVAGITRYIGGNAPALVATDHYQSYCLLRGLDLTDEQRVGGLGRYLQESRSLDELAAAAELAPPEARRAVAELVERGLARRWYEADRYHSGAEPCPSAAPPEEQELCARLLEKGLTLDFLRAMLAPPPESVLWALSELLERGWVIRWTNERQQEIYLAAGAPPAEVSGLRRQLYERLATATGQGMSLEELLAGLLTPPAELEAALARMVERGWACRCGGKRYFRGVLPSPLPETPAPEAPAPTRPGGAAAPSPAPAPGAGAAQPSELEYQIYYALTTEKLWSSERLGALQRLPQRRMRELLDRLATRGLVERAEGLDRYVRAESAPAAAPGGLAPEAARLFAELRGARSDFRVKGEEGLAGCVVGVGTLELLELNVGDLLRLTVQESAPGPGQIGQPSGGYFIVVDVYETGNFIFDRGVLVDLGEAGELYRLPGWSAAHRPPPAARAAGPVTGLCVWLKDGADYAQTEVACRQIRALKEPYSLAFYEVRTWRELQPDLFDMLTVQNVAMQIILSLLLLAIAAFILFMFWVLVTDRTRNIGILRALGARAPGVAGIFLSAGCLLVLLATGGGIALGLFLSENARLNWIVRRIPGLAESLNKLFLLKSVPSAVNAADLARLVAFTFITTLLATLVAALRAALIHPAEALRYE